MFRYVRGLLFRKLITRIREQERSSRVRALFLAYVEGEATFEETLDGISACYHVELNYAEEKHDVVRVLKKIRDDIRLVVCQFRKASSLSQLAG